MSARALSPWACSLRTWLARRLIRRARRLTDKALRIAPWLAEDTKGDVA